MNDYNNEQVQEPIEQKKRVYEKNEPSVLSLAVAIILHLFAAIPITYGSYLWVLNRVEEYFDVNYAGYALLLIVILVFSEAYAIFILIPQICGYEMVSAWLDTFLKRSGYLLLMLTLLLLACYCMEGSVGQVTRLWL